MPLLDEVLALDADRVTVWADDERGRLATADDLLVGASPTTAVYVCGPTGMLESVRIARHAHANAPLHYERFSPPPVVDGIPFELELARSQRVLDVPANRSALDVMLDIDPTAAHSCRQGLLRHLQGRGCSAGRSTVAAAPSEDGRRDAGVCLASDRRPRGDRRLGRRRQVQLVVLLVARRVAAGATLLVIWTLPSSVFGSQV